MTAYLHNHKRYPIVTARGDVLEALRDPFHRAVTLRIPELKFDEPNSILAPACDDLAQLYWRDPDHERGRRASGETIYLADVAPTDILKESTEGGIEIADPDDIKKFADGCNTCRSIFTETCNALITRPIQAQRGFVLFTPQGGRGRSPEVHIDKTNFTLHWAAALAKFKIMFGEADEKLWDALHRIKQPNITPEERAPLFEFLVAAASDPRYDFRDNEIGDMIITKGHLDRDLTNPDDREDLCIHVSSPTVIQNGQAAFLMTPQMPKPVAA